MLPDIALSVRQPWAWLICQGLKDIENRTWHTTFRGEFLIHAGKQIDFVAWAFLKADHPEIEFPSDSETGGIVGMARLVACTTHHSSSWFEGPYGFLLTGAKTLPFIPGPGRLKFFKFVPSKGESANVDTARLFR